MSIGAKRAARMGALAGLLLLAVWVGRAQARPGYLQYPDIHGDQVVFTAEGDLWIASVDGGEARRLTSGPGDEVLPKFSPDGRWIAFAGDYDGNRDLFVVPASGGEPKRLTWHPAPDEPVGWTPDGREILFRSAREAAHWDPELYRVSATGGDPVKIPIGHVVTFAIDPETGRYAFTRNGGGGTWKRYRGGTADDIWVGSPQAGDYTKVTSFAGMDAFPMWHGGRIYFLCDQGGTANLWSMQPDGSDRRKLTDFDTWDARFPSIDAAGRIVFMLAGDIHLYDIASKAERALSIDLPSERLLTRIRYPNAGRYLTEFALAPEGDRLAVVTRGEIFSVAAKEGVTFPVTHGSGAREKWVGYDPKGDRMVYVTDASGEEVIVTADAWGRSAPKTVTPTGTSAWHFPPVWSPDGARIAYADQSHTLFVVDASGGDPAAIDHSEQAEISQYVWSPDGRWLAYTKPNSLERGAICIYDTKEKKTRAVTGPYTDDRSPAWDPEGRYLYFLSDRTVDPVLDTVDFESILARPTRPYLLCLRPDVPDPFANTKGAPPDEKAGAKDKKDGKSKAGGKDKGKDKDKGKAAGASGKKGSGEREQEEEKVEPIEIDFDGLADRVVEVPVDAGRYYGLSATKENLFYISLPVQGIVERHWDEDQPPNGSLMMYNLEDREEKTFLDGVRSYDLQPRSGKIAVQKQKDEIYVFDADSPPGEKIGKHKVDLDGLVVELAPQEEWRQIYLEAWREMRTFYWDPGMHGVDWEAVRDQYASLLPRIATREQLQDLIAEMIGELATSHTYVWGGDRGVQVPHRRTGLLGAVLQREGSAFKVQRIYRADAADRVRSPLQNPGVGINEGDYIVSVNQQGFSPDEPFEARLENLAGKEVLLGVNSRPDTAGARAVVVKALDLGEDQELRYADWVRKNREYVSEKTGGKIGYIHIPDMGSEGLKEFDTWFYPQLDKEGMVVDVRYNAGGFVSQLILARFMRHILGWDRARWGGISTYPYRTLNGPFVVLLNQFAGSDGDIFPDVVKSAGLAPIIGERSWGGVNGIRGGRELVDAGMVTNPEFAWWDLKTGWGVENHGVDPDIEVEDLPQEIARGVDAQLDRGIAEVMRLRQEHPPLLPTFGPEPDRSRAAYRGEK